MQNVYLAFYRRIQRYGHLDVLFPRAFLLKMLRREIIEQYVEREKRSFSALEDVPQERLRDETPLDPKDIKSLSAALLDLRSQLGGGQSAPEPLTVRFVDLDGAEE